MHDRLQVILTFFLMGFSFGFFVLGGSVDICMGNHPTMNI